MRRKIGTYQGYVKSVARTKTADGAEGTAEAIVSVFGNVDLVRDRVMPGAFTDTLKAWRESGDPIPVIWSHQWADPFAHIGSVAPADATETPDGLKVKMRFDLDKPFAAQVFDLMAERRVREFSFAYDVVDEARDSKGVNELKRLDLIEVGPTLKGANPDTMLLGTKGGKAWVNLEGSWEDAQEDILEAAQAWGEANIGPGVYAMIQATYPDVVIVQYAPAMGDFDPDDGFWRFAWTYDEATDMVTLADPTPVAIEATVTEKARAHAVRRYARKEGRRNAATDQQMVQTMHDTAVKLGAACPTDSGATEDPTSGKAAPAAEDRGNGKVSDRVPVIPYAYR